MQMGIHPQITQISQMAFNLWQKNNKRNLWISSQQPCHLWIAFLLCNLWAYAHAEDTRHYSVDAETKAATMTVGGKVCWTYSPTSEEGKPYFHPLAVPGTGEVLTWFRPADHKWHIGLWFTWKFINGVNFWEPDKDAERKILSHTETCDADKVFVAKATLSYIAKGTEALREERVTRVVTQENGNYTIEWDATFTAQNGDAKLDCTPAKQNASGIWASGGYAGLMWRFASNPPGTYTFTDTEGRTDAKTCGHASPWIESAITLPSGTKAKVRFTDHPDNPRYPNTWFSRHQPTALNNTGYNILSTGLVFHEPLVLENGKPMRVRYTVTVERVAE